MVKGNLQTPSWRQLSLRLMASKREVCISPHSEEILIGKGRAKWKFSVPGQTGGVYSKGGFLGYCSATSPLQFILFQLHFVFHKIHINHFTIIFIRVIVLPSEISAAGNLRVALKCEVAMRPKLWSHSSSKEALEVSRLISSNCFCRPPRDSSLVQFSQTLVFSFESENLSGFCWLPKYWDNPHLACMEVHVRHLYFAIPCGASLVLQLNCMAAKEIWFTRSF